MSNFGCQRLDEAMRIGFLEDIAGKEQKNYTLLHKGDVIVTIMVILNLQNMEQFYPFKHMKKRLFQGFIIVLKSKAEVASVFYMNIIFSTKMSE